jgi:WD40 repeat protein
VLALFIGDAIKFVEKFKEPIAQNAAHIYISALPFAHSHSLVSQHYLPRYPHTLVVKGGPQTWDKKEPVSVLQKACLSVDGTCIAAVFDDGTLCIYDTRGDVILLPFKVDENPRSVIFSRDGKLVATGGQALRLWNTQTGEEVESFDIDVYSLALSPDGTCIAAGCAGSGDDGEGREGSYNIRVINIELAAKIPHPYVPPGGGGIKLLKGEVPPSPFEGHKGDVHSIAYSPDGKQIASCSEDRTVQVWDVSTGSRRTFSTNSVYGFYSVAFSPDGTQIAAGLTLINLSTGRLTRLGGEMPALSSAFSADGRYLASGTIEPAAFRIWNASTHQTIVELVGHRNHVRSVAFFPDGKQIMSASEDGTIRVWDIKLLEERGEMDGWQVPVKGYLEGPGYWIFGPEGEYLFWTPFPFRHARNTLVIGEPECPKIDFSNFVHGDEWVKCREPL